MVRGAVGIGGNSKKVNARGTLWDRSLAFLPEKAHFTGDSGCP